MPMNIINLYSNYIHYTYTNSLLSSVKNHKLESLMFLGLEAFRIMPWE